MRESDLLSHLRALGSHLLAGRSGVAVGPGDDCALVHAPSGSLLLKADQVVQGRHFSHDTPADLVARKALARPLSDIAAKGGRPLWALAAVVFPAHTPGPRATLLADAVHRWGLHWSCPVVGGDIATHADAASPLTLCVSIVGSANPRRTPLRSDALPGDGVYVTGQLGGSLGSQRHLTFEPRLAEGAWLVDHLADSLGAMMDISDGLGRDAARIAGASGVRLRLDHARLPLHADAGGWRAGASDGEDHELLFTARAGAVVPPACPLTGVAITRIGVCERGEGCTISTPGGEIDASGMGWDH